MGKIRKQRTERKSGERTKSVVKRNIFEQQMAWIRNTLPGELVEVDSMCHSEGVVKYSIVTKQLQSTEKRVGYGAN